MRVLAALAAALLLLAGCSDPATPPPDDDIDLDEDLVATEDTGIIRGIVVDPAIVPIQNVTIRILSLERTTTTNANGAFGFADIEPGTYFLEATKPGFNATQISVDVEAGVQAPPIVKIQLLRNELTGPYVDPLYFKGFLRCSLSYIALCGVSPGLTGDDFLETWEITPGPLWINMEAVWEGTQPTGDQLNMNMGRTPAGPGTTCCTAQGPSPLLIQANETVIVDGGIGTEGDLVHRMFAWEMEGTGIDDHTGMCVYVVLTTYCQGPGVAIDQSYEVFVHLFYNWVPDMAWRFTVDGEPIPPS